MRNNSGISSLIKKYIKNLLRFLFSAFRGVYDRVVVMNKYEQTFVIGLFVLTFLLIFSPIMVLSPNDDGASSQFIFLLGRVQLLKTMLVVFISLFLILSRHINIKFKNYIIEYIGFDKNTYLFSFFLLFSVLSSIMALGDSNNIIVDYTTMIHMHTMYYIIQILLITLVGFCLYMLIHESQGGFTGHVVGYGTRKSQSSSDDDMQGLFGDLKEE